MSLEIRGLEKTFAGGFRLSFRLSIDGLAVAPGETLALAGPRAAAKPRP
ncbi:MAG: hypothetical protein LBU19_08300 [Treponema sp.]|jgi:hypothetical protein|nr:hypothetical protein [Treponema sp.]